MTGEIEQFKATRTQKRKNDGKFVFDSDVINNEVWAAATATTDASLSIYDVPTGKKFHLRTVIVYSPDVAAQLLELHTSGSTMVIPFNLTSGPTTIIFTGLQGPYWDGDAVYLNYGSYTTATPLQITIGGILEPEE